MKRILILSVLSLALVFPCFRAVAQDSAPAVTEEHDAVPPVPGLVVPFVMTNVEHQFYRPIVNGHHTGAGQFSFGYVAGVTFRPGWEEHGGGLTLISVGYYRQIYGAHSEVVFSKQTSVCQGLYLSIDAPLAPFSVPGLNLCAVFSAGRFGSLKHKDLLEHPFYQPNDPTDMSTGFEGLKVSYRISYLPAGSKFGIVFQPAFAFGYSHCFTSCLSIKIEPMLVRDGKAVF